MLRDSPLLREIPRSAVDEARAVLHAAIAREERRLTKRVLAVEGDLAKGRDAETFAEEARLFVAEAARAPRGTRALTTIDWATGDPVTRELLLDPAKRPRDQLEAIFAKARRLKRGAAVAAGRISEAKAKLARLAALTLASKEATTLEELADAQRNAHLADPSLLPASTVPRARAERALARASGGRVAYRTFVAASGARILVGKGASDNDELTLHVARPQDLWLHVKEQAGAHVVVPMQKGHDAPAELLVDAAHLAAHFSDARDEAIVDVTYVQKRHVRKPRGSAPGLVVVARERVLALRVDAARLKGLLAREEG